jgi:hypothetical protein
MVADTPAGPPGRWQDLPVPKAADQLGGPELAARFAGAYAGSYPVEDALRWAQEAVPAPSLELRRRRRELYRQAVDPAAIRQYQADSDAWDAELRLIRTAYSAATTSDSPADGTAEPAEPVDRGSPSRRRRWSRSRLFLAIGGVAVAVAVAAAVAQLGTPAPVRHTASPGPSTVVLATGSLLVQRTGQGGGTDGVGLDGSGRYITIAVTCQGNGGVTVLLSDDTNAHFGCIATFPRTTVATSRTRLRTFNYSLRTTGSPSWAVSLFR